MKKYEIYLAGPITGLTYDDCTSWRDYVKNNLPDYIHTLSPMRGKDHLAIKKQTDDNHVIQNSYEGNVMTSSKGINTRDYNDVKRSDVVLINLLDTKKVSIGTVMEIAWCRAFDIPTILIMEDEGNIHEHVMLTYDIGFRVTNLEQAISVAISLCSTDQELKRS